MSDSEEEEEITDRGSVLEKRQNEFQKILLFAVRVENIALIRKTIAVMERHHTSPYYIYALQAAARGRGNVILTLLRCGFNVNNQDSNGNTALHIACKVRSLDNVMKLVTWGGNIKIKNNNDESPIENLTGHAFWTEKGKALHGPYPNESSVDTRNLLAEFEKIFKIALFLIIQSDGYNASDPDDNKAITNLLATCPRQVVHLVVQRGYDVRQPDKLGYNALHVSVRYGNWHSTAALLNDIDANCVANNMTTPLHVATAFGWPFCAEELLLNGANINAINSAGRSPLCEAVITNSVNAFKVTEVILVRKPAMRRLMKSTLDPSEPFRERFGSNKQMRKLLVEHILSMIAANIEIDDYLVFEFLTLMNDSIVDTREFLGKHAREIKDLMKMKFLPNFSAYDLLTLHPDNAAYLMNDEIIIFFKAQSHEIRFPLYAKYLEATYRKAFIRKHLIDTCFCILQKIFSQCGLRDKFIRIILDYCTDFQLRQIANFIEIYRK